MKFENPIMNISMFAMENVGTAITVSNPMGAAEEYTDTQGTAGTQGSLELGNNTARIMVAF